MIKLFFIFILFLGSTTNLFSQTLQWARQYQNMPLAFNYTSAVATDNSGNVYVTGQSDSIPNGTDFTTIKYNSSGVMQWIRRYNGPINGQDDAKSISIDGSGNIYVSGNSEGADTTIDFATVKYNSSGVQQWVARYNGPAGDNENLGNMVIDNSGNVYITGASTGDAVTLTDIATIKYNTSGVQQWVMRYDSGNEDFLPLVRVSSTGNVYVTGTTINDTTGQNYVTIKYNSTGVQQWAKTYNGPAGGDDSPTAIAVDPSDNVFVTGTTNASIEPNFATVKYNSAGTQQWTSIYNDSSDNAVSLALDNSGNIYVGGTTNYYNSYTSTCVTLKYNSSGVQQWVKLFTAVPFSSNYPIKILTDTPGNIYVALDSYSDLTGNDIAILKYSSSGTQQWIAKYNYTGTSNDGTSDMVLDASGNILMSGNTFSFVNFNTYMTTVKFSQTASGSSLQLTGYIEAFYNPSTDIMVSDTARVYLRSTVSPYNKIDSSKGILNSSGTGTFNFTNAVNGTNYYLVVKHRNSIETWSNSGNAFVSNSLIYNFTTALTKAYGNNQIQVDPAPLRFGFFSGDVNQDGFVDLTDVLLVYNDASNFVTGYVNSDVNGNNVTDLTDIIITYNNSVSFVKR
ncbi:MAG: SBBP repeat-containing protein [Ignavibacteria bacterium]|nr:SBBP repeat-containing protein [Ignavibacteria bacterium]